MQANNPGNSGNSANQSGSQSGSSNNTKPTLSWSGQDPKQKPATTVSSNNISKSAVTTTMPMNDRSSTSAYIGIFVAGLVVGVLVGWGITSLHNTSNDMAMTTSTASSSSAAMAMASNTSTGATTSTGSVTNMDLSGATIGAANTTASSQTTMSSSNALTVAAQPAGSSVKVSGVSVSKPTWVAVYDDNNGKQGNVLGAAMFFPTSQGGSTSGSVSLLRPTTSGKTYLVGELLDNGSHTFSTKTDTVVTVGGSSVLGQFTAQ